MSKLHSIYPQSQKNSYTENDSIDFLLTFDDVLKPNSVYLTGELAITFAGGATEVFCDGMCGVHNFFTSWNTEIDGTFIENIQEYTRYYKQKHNGLETTAQIFSEGKGDWRADDAMTKYILQGLGVDPNHLPFSLQPDTCLNRMKGHIQGKPIRINTRLNVKNDALYGADVANASYTITNLQLHYRTQELPKENDREPVEMNIVNAVRNSIVSSTHNFSSNIPLEACLGVSGCFIKESDLTTATLNSVKMEQVPSLSRIEYKLADANGYLSYSLKDREEILYNYLQAIQSRKHNAIRLQKLVDENEGFGIGLKLNGVDLSKNKISVNVASGIDNTAPYVMFLFFTGLVRL